MLNTPRAEREIFKALQVIAAETETDLGEIIDALTGYAWGEEEREDLRKMIPDILADCCGAEGRAGADWLQDRRGQGQ